MKQFLLPLWILLAVLSISFYLYPAVSDPTTISSTSIVLNPAENTIYNINRENSAFKIQDISFLYFLAAVESNFSLEFFALDGTELQIYYVPTESPRLYYDTDVFLDRTYSVEITNLNSSSILEMMIRSGIFSKPTGIALLAVQILLFTSFYFMVGRDRKCRILSQEGNFSRIINIFGYLFQLLIISLILFFSFIATLTPIH